MKAHRFSLAAAIAVLSNAGVPAHADWEATRWGMTPDEALAVLENAVSHDPTPAELYHYDGAAFAPIVKLPHEINGIEGEASLLFDSDSSLSYVLFDPADVAECEALHETLVAQLGDPDALNKEWMSVSDWVEGPDTVKLTRLASSGICNLSYAPA